MNVRGVLSVLGVGVCLWILGIFSVRFAWRASGSPERFLVLCVLSFVLVGVLVWTLEQLEGRRTDTD